MRCLEQQVVLLGEALFPPACGLCGAAADERGSCDAHRLRGQSAAPHCGRCAALLPVRIPDGNLCSACRLDPPRWSRLVALTDYADDPAARAWILALKHGARRDLARPLGEFLAQRVRRAELSCELPSCVGAAVVSVPLHPAREFVRGYDQARLLARAMALELGLVCVRGLRRTRATTPQGAPGAVSRIANVRGAFAPGRGLRDRIAGRTVLLVDDVVTSGATANECVRCLVAAGAARVVVVCLARASPRPNRLGATREPP